MTIFTQPINEINYEDVVSFCQQGIKEGINLDYKKDFPKRGLEKTISAFANSFGGVIIIGVEDRDSKPKPPFKGIEYKERLEEKVWNIILDNVYPPIFPEIRICPPQKSKTFVIIRVPQSNETPHAIYNNTQAYIRTGNRNKPEDLATMEQIDWLRNRREKSEKLREILYRKAEERYQNICKSEKAKIEFGEFTLSFAPLYPQKPLFLVEEIENISQTIKVFSKYDDKFPRLPSPLQPIQNGMFSFHLSKIAGSITYTEINQFGLIFYKEDMGCVAVKEKESDEDEKIISLSSILGILSVALESVSKFYKQVGYWGLIEIKFSLQGLIGVYFRPLIPRSSFIFPGDINQNYIEKQLSWQFIISVAQLDEPIPRQRKLIDLVKEIAWSFGVKIKEELIERSLKERGRWVQENKEKTENDC